MRPSSQPLVRVFSAGDQAEFVLNVLIRVTHEEIVIVETGNDHLKQIVEVGIMREQQPDGSYKWYAIHPKTKTRVEIDPEQAWFWTADWQEREHQADEDVRLKRYEDFDDFDDFLNSL